MDRAGGLAPAPTAVLPWEGEEVVGLHFPEENNHSLLIRNKREAYLLSILTLLVHVCSHTK